MKMKKMQTCNLIGPQLNYTVARALGLALYNNALLNSETMCGWWVSGRYDDPNIWTPLNVLKYSTDWAFGGPIIKREHISLMSPTNQLTANWVAETGINDNVQWDHCPLVAAMRCFCESKFGTEVEIPEDLL